MKMREIISLVENFMTDNDETDYNSTNIDYDYYMSEGCGIFAIALSRVIPGGEIYILSNVSMDAEEWSDDIPYEVTHVFYKVNGKTHDVRGARSSEDMAKELLVVDFIIRGPWQPKDFAARFMGESDDFPLYGDETSILEAIRFIKEIYI